MKLVYLALVALSSLTLSSCKNLNDQESYKFDMRRRLGHFAEAPFTDLYKHYAVAFIAPTYENLSHDDYRNYRPSADVCRAFFASFVGQTYQIHELDQVIVLDACLGYVVGGVYEQDPDASADNKAQFAALASDQNLVDLYQTRLGEFGAAERTCVADLLLNSVLAKKQYPDLECNNFMLQLYIDFAECQQNTPLASFKSDDPYVKLVYELVKERVNKCVEHEISHINEAVLEKFGKDWFKRAKFSLTRNKGRKQQGERKWPKPIMQLLQAIQNVDGEVNLRQVHQLLASVQHNDAILRKRFLDNIAEFADRQIRPDKKRAKQGTLAYGDTKGLRRYRDLVDRTCQFFRSSDSEKDYDFATPIIRLVRLLKHVELFDYSQGQFVDMMLTSSYESAPLYMCVSACNLLTYTEGTYSATGKGQAHYEVHFVPDTSSMVVWPKADWV